MVKSILSILCLLLFSSAFAQNNLKKIPIGASGCSAYFSCEPAAAEVKDSDDGSKVYSMSCITNQVETGLICVQLKEKIEDIKTAENLMISYMDFLKQNFKIKAATGYGLGHTLAGNDRATGVIDYWTDEGNVEWVVKGWTDGNFIAVLFAAGNATTLKEQDSRIQAYLNGFRFAP